MTGDTVAREVIEKAGLPTNALLTRVGGGFSDAAVWRVDCSSGSYALKQYPPTFDANRLQAIHQLLGQARQASITAIPEVHYCVEHANALWDLVSWQPGVAALSYEPTPARLAAAGSVLGRLHAAWASSQRTVPKCPAIERRLTAFADWTSLHEQSPHGDLIDGIRATVNRHITALQSDLHRWSNHAVTAQACLCDCWHAHFLFTGDEITGLIDHAAVQLDHPVVDLARLLGSLDLAPAQRRTFLDSYELNRPLKLDDHKMLCDLERSGILGGLMHWFRRLAGGQPISAEASERIRFLLQRAEKLN